MQRAPVTAVLAALSRRGYAAAAAGAESQQRTAAAAVSAAGGGASNGAAASKEVFWMRDPQTGCWAPEDRFTDEDAAELRARLLARKG